MTPYICAHTRSGTHILASILYNNYQCDVSDYEQLHYSHSRLPPEDTPYVFLFRPILPVMVSIWRVREHLGISSKVSFQELIRTPWEQMPRSEVGPAKFNGFHSDKVCSPRDFTGTLPLRWVNTNRMFHGGPGARLGVNYDTLISRPLYVAQKIAEKFGLRKSNYDFYVPMHKVGWQPVSDENPVICQADYELLETFQEELSWLFSSRS